HLPDAPRPPMIQHSLLNTIFSGISPLPKVSAGSRYAPTQSVGAIRKTSVPFRVFREHNLLAFFESETTCLFEICAKRLKSIINMKSRHEAEPEKALQIRGAYFIDISQIPATNLLFIILPLFRPRRHPPRATSLRRALRFQCRAIRPTPSCPGDSPPESPLIIQGGQYRPWSRNQNSGPENAQAAIPEGSCGGYFRRSTGHACNLAQGILLAFLLEWNC
ncbi:hypothetical protein, partial [Desulfonatronospira sp.]|uniref:hypothetical protein n=1 Tax=Desulfonatronospira sp. TaxID=1962951 RepID=UPI0025C27A19